MISMYIGSGDVAALLSGVKTKTFEKLMQRFVSNEIPYYNAKMSPIDALRTGAILEERYGLILPDDYYPQVKVISDEMDVFKASLDFSKMDNGKVVDFDELKCISLTDFLEIEKFREDTQSGIEYIKKAYKNYYNQVQEQLFCSKLDEANLVFLAVYSYNDEENYFRDIQENEFIKFRIKRDEEVISRIKEKGDIFQKIKDFFC